jgi:hypothetical protein
MIEPTRLPATFARILRSVGNSKLKSPPAQAALGQVSVVSRSRSSVNHREK